MRQRVQRLLDAEVMQIVAVTDPLQVGFQRQAMIGIRVDGDLTAVGDALTEMAEVAYVVTTAGQLRPARRGRLRGRRPPARPAHQPASARSRASRSTETFVYLKLNKQHYNWGTR